MSNKRNIIGDEFVYIPFGINFSAIRDNNCGLLLSKFYQSTMRDLSCTLNMEFYEGTNWDSVTKCQQSLILIIMNSVLN